MSHDPPTHKISLGEIGVGHAETCVRLGKNDPARGVGEGGRGGKEREEGRGRKGDLNVIIMCIGLDR